MPLANGARIGPYEITSTLGAGGMGEVYRARDTKLGREVALKVISDAFALDPDRLARFQREAQVLASLNHPHIGAIYGFEDGGETHALVLELVEGDTLADRIARGPLPLDEALPIARQIAEALEAAHEHGIIHRDLKPANIKVTPDGVVKVLDFGLAKMLEAGGAGRSGRSGGSGGGGNLTNSPTLTSPAMMTGVGAILGTAAYMSPEQAKGRDADKRCDVWAFGCVLYEMLTGHGPFAGDDVSDTLANVLKREPDFSVLPPDVTPPIRLLLHQCLVKDRRARVADLAAALFVLDHQAAMAPASAASIAPPSPGPRWRRIAALTAGALGVAGLAVTLTWLAVRPPPPRVVVTTITTSGSARLMLSGTDRDLAITPDGLRVVYRGDNQLLVRALNQLEPTTVLSGLGAPRGVFISPDGRWVGFFDGTAMKKVAITGGPPETVGAIEGNPRGAAWHADGTIIFATTSPVTGLQRVSAAGGVPVVLTTPDRQRGESDHLWPELLPGGDAVLFTITSASGLDNAQVAVLDLQTGKWKALLRGGSHAHYVPTGHLVYGFAGTLRAVAFDRGRLEVVGAPEPVLDGVVMTTQGAADIALAANGSLVYVPGLARGGGRRTLVSMDRQGRASPLPGLTPDTYRDVRVSPDGGRLAVATDTEVSTYDVRRATLSRLTTDPAPDRSPFWTPDGQRIVFTSLRAGYAELFWRAADGTGTDQRLFARVKGLSDLIATDWSPDGRQLLFTEVPPNITCAIGQVDINRVADATLLVSTEFCNAHGTVSPNGRWLAYRSRTSGDEIYVERYPELGGRVQISTGGGTIPVWSRDGRELFFISTDGRQMFSVAVQTGTMLAPGRPQLLFESAMAAPAGGGRPYDIAPDGRFVVIQSDQTEVSAVRTSNIILVQNWFEELKRLVPSN